jgi:hypothetical protein
MAKLTRKDINVLRSIGYTVYNVPYCEAQHLLTGLERFGYNAGIYGWNWSAYKVYDAIIVTGYRNFPCGKEVPNLAEHEATAAEILRGFATPYHEKMKELDELRTKLFAQ